MRDVMASIVSLRGVSRRYVRGAECVDGLRDVDLEIAAGAFVALLGPAGAGKTTLLNLIAGLDAPHAGTVIVAGERIDTLGPRQLRDWRTRHIGLAFYVDYLVPVLTVGRNVEIPLLAQALSSYERRREVMVALDRVGLAGHAQRLPSQLSPGQRRRAAIARAIVSRPALLVCDEPTANLAGDTTDEVLEVLRDLSERFEMTVVMATDDPVAAACASRVIVLESGRVSPAPRAQVAA
jgi:putative ABC transport system ATP-binding protein